MSLLACGYQTSRQNAAHFSWVPSGFRRHNEQLSERELARRLQRRRERRFTGGGTVGVHHLPGICQDCALQRDIRWRRVTKQVLTAVLMKTETYRAVTPCVSVKSSWRFERYHCLHPQGQTFLHFWHCRWRHYDTPKRRLPFTCLQAITYIYKINIEIIVLIFVNKIKRSSKAREPQDTLFIAPTLLLQRYLG